MIHLPQKIFLLVVSMYIEKSLNIWERGIYEMLKVFGTILCSNGYKDL